MSAPLASPEPSGDDLARLRAAGYATVVIAGHLVIDDIPYVTTTKAVRRGRLVSTLQLHNDVVQPPDTHVVMFAGETPCDEHGTPLTKIINASGRQQLAERLFIDHTLSSKPNEGYPNYFAKMTAYIEMISGPAAAIDPAATPRTFSLHPSGDTDNEVFKYLDTASSRAGIRAVADRLALKKVVIIGLGGTGAHVLDLLAKTHIREIHLYDADYFGQHNAFRAPGPISPTELELQLTKVELYARRYGAMRDGIVAHPYHVDAGTVGELSDADFVFICIDSGPSRRLIVEALETYDRSFIDVGMGLESFDGRIDGMLRITASTPARREHVRDRHRIPFDDGADDEYAHNIQIVDLNALNANLAVIRFKQIVGFYHDSADHHFSVFTVNDLNLINEDGPT
ncbi:MAG: ThiF family adenylyltransferase [Actinomycetia bacterium]|nr:ThiF family adenylyltransferase [Actinomycetes bacterium]